MICNVIYLVQCKELDIFKEFTDQETAYTFATQLEQDYPEVSIQRFKYTMFTDEWDTSASPIMHGNALGVIDRGRE
ncbi:hypothetical protein [Moraxella ovis]|uniref:hypothetical protein n=1 Tax=Moraxella ovis TaxID=29433 RepID=UPI000D867D06|nr:hypothetical protein [Moraxella ovis]SPX84703.1 Uncharacterised protein [Moraxella ovis]STZ06550.1 Uncharacterised protein [Moraxella ovis]